MPSTPDTSDSLLKASASADPELGSPERALELTDEANEKLSPHLAIISEHNVMLGSAAALAGAPSFEGELEREDALIEQQEEITKNIGAQRRISWLGMLAKRFSTSRDRRPPRQHYPSPRDSQFIADARMDREMYRL